MDVIRHLHQRSTLGKLTRGAIASTASVFKVHRSTISRIWKAYHQNALLPSLKAGRVGRPTVYTPEVVASTVRELPQSLRSTMRDMSEATGIPLPSLHRALKAGTIQRRSTRIKPLLTDENRAERLAFCRSLVPPVLTARVPPQAAPAKPWFNADKNIRKVYLTAGEEPEQRAWSSKRFVPKVMFLAAVAPPRYDEARGMYFDGNLGIWPFLEFAPAALLENNGGNHFRLPHLRKDALRRSRALMSNVSLD
ncbi:hypothetical protein DYB35_007058 [Aphanomyces astaci]|uniref:DUF7769 domain-containing protein n=1 Tax=Aphanomyces astaci TaxID=112090 RepID=A0A418CRM3_APHAT|nr:hypothetical protein DYB35_007058 [Aphanomyces astaci]